MWDLGLVGEVRGLVDVGLRQGRTASRAVGYAQVLAALDGRTTMSEAMAATAQATRRLVRRQESWFRRDPRIHWLDATGAGPPRPGARGGVRRRRLTRDDGAMGRQLTFTKGHGTENDFVLVRDLDGSDPVDAATARWLSDRHAGIGGDGVIRVVPTALVAEVADQADEAPWFMDYRNADGSVAEMCGNGVRVFARYLVREGLVPPPEDGAPELAVATRNGVRPVRFEPDGSITVDLGPWRVAGGADAARIGSDCEVTIANLPGPLRGLSLDLGNPHTVVALPAEAELELADLTRAPVVEPVPAARHERGAGRPDRPRPHPDEGVRARGRRDPLLRHGHRRRRAGHPTVGRVRGQRRLAGRRARRHAAGHRPGR